MQYIEWDGKTMPFEMYLVKLSKEGFKIQFTKPIDPDSLVLSNLKVSSYVYNYWANYGSEQIDQKVLSASGIKVSEDKKTVEFNVPLEKQRIYRIELNGLKSASGDLLINQKATYTLNNLISNN